MAVAKRRAGWGQVVRLCLYVGIEPIFIPVGEARRNGDVERLHGIWDQAVWQQVHFDSVKAAQDFTPQFEQWYMNEYEPPKLNGQTPQEAADDAPRYRLPRTVRPSPKYCRLSPDGSISFGASMTMARLKC